MMTSHPIAEFSKSSIKLTEDSSTTVKIESGSGEEWHDHPHGDELLADFGGLRCSLIHGEPCRCRWYGYV